MDGGFWSVFDCSGMGHLMGENNGIGDWDGQGDGVVYVDAPKYSTLYTHVYKTLALIPAIQIPSVGKELLRYTESGSLIWVV